MVQITQKTFKRKLTQVHCWIRLTCLGALLMFFAGCKTKLNTAIAPIQAQKTLKQPSIAPGGVSPESDNGLGAIPFANFEGFKYLKGKLKFEYELNGSGHKATASLRMAEDSLIWLSITPGLGIEVMRVLFTTDSLMFVDKINKNYASLSYDQTGNLIGAPINFKMVQAIILGNTLPIPVNNIIPDSAGGKPLVYKLITLGNSTITQLLTPQLNRSTEVLIETPKPKSTMWIQYSNHQSILNFSQLFPLKKTIVIDQSANGGTGKLTIDIEHQKTEWADSTLQFPYYVPEGYSNMVQVQLKEEK
jgi:hypothetical protein